MVKQQEKQDEKTDFTSKGKYKGKKYNNKGKTYKPLKCPYCNEKDKESLETRGNQLSCLTCGNDSDRY